MYEAIRSMKVQAKHGVEIRQPGDAVPEAAGWANPDLWVKRGYLKKVEAKEEKVAAVKLAVVPSEPEAPAPKRYVAIDEERMNDLCMLKRKDLNERAEDLGIERPERYPTKTDIARAIVSAQMGVVVAE